MLPDELLTICAKVKGDAAARALAEGVLDNPNDTGRADAVRRRILEELSGIVPNQGVR